MNTEFSPEQDELQSLIVSFLNRHRLTANAQSVTYLDNPPLEQNLILSGFLDLAKTEEYGLFEAVLLVEAVSQLPYSVEIAASAIVGAGLCTASLPRPLALAMAPLTAPIRYLPGAKAVLVDTGQDVRLVDTSKCTVRTIETQFAYPLGVFEEVDLDSAPILLGASREKFRQLWQLAIAAEACGLMQGAVDLTVRYLKDRRQFGRPIGSFQALQHRISECATMLESLRVLMQKAASSGDPVDAALAAYYAQEVGPRIVLDCQQMHGAMGCTLEYPLHFWTYRLKVLQGELGGAFGQARSAAGLLWT